MDIGKPSNVDHGGNVGGTAPGKVDLFGRMFFVLQFSRSTCLLILNQSFVFSPAGVSKSR